MSLVGLYQSFVSLSIMSKIVFWGMIFVAAYIFLVIWAVNLYMSNDSRKAKKAKKLSSNYTYSAAFSKKTSYISIIFGLAFAALFVLILNDFFIGGKFSEAMNYNFLLFYGTPDNYSGDIYTHTASLSSEIALLKEMNLPTDYYLANNYNHLFIYVYNVFMKIIPIIATIGPTMILLYFYYKFGAYNESVNHGYVFVNEDEVLLANPGVTRAKLKLAEIESITVTGYAPSFKQTKQVDWD